jgi:chemotaxis protein histidine kinase CheA
MSSKIEHRLAEFRITFIAEFNDKLAVLSQSWINAKTSQSLDTVKQFRFEVHSLRGSSGSLNFLTLCDKLGVIEQKIATCEEKIDTLKSVVTFIDRHMKVMIEASRNDPNPFLVLKEADSFLKEFVELQKKINHSTVLS